MRKPYIREKRKSLMLIGVDQVGLRERLLEALKRENKPIHMLSPEVGIAVNTIANFLAAVKEPRLDTLAMILDWVKESERRARRPYVFIQKGIVAKSRKNRLEEEEKDAKRDRMSLRDDTQK